MIISVVTPTLNSARWIEACAGSVRMQAGPGVDVEHVVIDGGSSDDTVELARRAGCRVVGDGDDEGIFDAVNKGTRASTGQLVGFLGADDVLMPGALDAIARRYVSSGRRWVTGSYQWTDGLLRPLGTIAAPPERLTAEEHAMLGWSWPLHMATYVERSLFDEIGGFDLRYPIAADYRFFCEAMRRTPFARVGQVVAVFRRHGDNTSMVDPATDELRQVSLDYGPTSPVRRAYYRLKVKAWVNVRNPRWAYRKYRPLPEAPALVDDDGAPPGDNGREAA
jgi:glycosyltransferase involved in cell wall biosynthesis